MLSLFQIFFCLKCGMWSSGKYSILLLICLFEHQCAQASVDMINCVYWNLFSKSLVFLLLTRELLSSRVVVMLLVRLNDRTCPSLVRRATSFSKKGWVHRRRSCAIRMKEQNQWLLLQTSGLVVGDLIKEASDCYEDFINEEWFVSENMDPYHSAMPHRGYES